MNSMFGLAGGAASIAVNGTQSKTTAQVASTWKFAFIIRADLEVKMGGRVNRES